METRCALMAVAYLIGDAVSSVPGSLSSAESAVYSELIAINNTKCFFFLSKWLRGEKHHLKMDKEGCSCPRFHLTPGRAAVLSPAQHKSGDFALIFHGTLQGLVQEFPKSM